jgi:hypothetical protein
MWWWRFRCGYLSKNENADALWFGIGVHEALAQWYGKGRRRGIHPARYFKNWVGEELREIRTYSDDSEWMPGDLAQYEDAVTLGVAMLTGYTDKYGKDDNWQVLATEQQFSVKIFRNGEPVGIFKSTFDGVYRDLDTGLIYLMEHKTAASISLPYLQMDNQAGSYWAVATQVLRAKGIIGPDEFISGIVYNFLRKSMPDDRPQNELGEYLNKNGSISKKQPAPLFVREIVERQPSEMRTQLERISDEIAVMNAERDGTIPIIKNTNRDCVRCEFFIPCQLQERGGEDYKEVLEADFIQSNPYDRYSVKSATE